MSRKESDLYVGEHGHHRRGRPKPSEGHSQSTVPPRLGVYPTYRRRGAVFATSGGDQTRRLRKRITTIVIALVVILGAAAYLWWQTGGLQLP